ncbi:MAG: hypothetical protein QOF04_27, partial [Solirubrobacteraceae bacterium]|nr:hypothetical protein [Solirubrobacteraceae bacterium]
DLERHGAAGLEPPPVWAGTQLAML